MNRTGIPYLDYGWNPCGFGCSNGCDGCWAHRMAHRMTCPACKRFDVHFHGERLTGKGSPAGPAKPGVVGVQFTGDLFDRARRTVEIYRTFDAAAAAPQHQYVYLTQQPEIMADTVAVWLKTLGRDRLPDNWFMGATVRTQAQFNRTLETMLDIPGRIWLSLEPLAGFVLVHMAPWHSIAGVVIGSDNRGSVQWDNNCARESATTARRIGAKVYIKQLQLWRCPNCGAWSDAGYPVDCPICRTPADHRRRTLAHDPATFPADLRSRDLPWTLQRQRKAIGCGLSPRRPGQTTGPMGGAVAAPEARSLKSEASEATEVGDDPT